MASYCDISQVEDLIPHLGSFDGTTTPTNAQVEAYILDVNSIVRGVVGSAGRNPDTTDPAAIEQLGYCCALGVVAQVLLSGQMSDVDAAQVFQSRYEGALARVRNGEVEGLPAAGGEGLMPRSHSTSHYPQCQTARFHVGRTEW